MPPVKRGDRYFYTRNSGQENQSTLYVREGRNGAGKPLMDPNGWSEDSVDAPGEWSPSDDGRFIAYGVQQGGTDWRTIHVLDIETGNVLEDTVEWARFTDIAWAPDDSGFFYTRFPEPEDARAAAGTANHAVYFHAIGTPQAKDRLIYNDHEHPENLTPIGRTSDGRYLTISPTPGADANMLALIDLESEDWTPRFLVDELSAEWGVVGNVETLVYATPNRDAERGKIVTFDMDDAEPQAKELVAEDEAVLNNAGLMGGRLVTAYLVDAKTEVRRFELDGAPDGVVQLAGIGSAGGFKGRSDDNEGLFLFSSFDTPITVYRYDVSANTYDFRAEPKLAANFDDVVVEQRFYDSKDGNRVPMFVVRKKDVTEPAPTLLYAYGGFGISIVPVYNPMQMAWVEKGGVLAVANIRGGEEYGRAWHQGGQFDKRQNA